MSSVLIRLAVTVAMTATAAADLKLTVLHANDMHAHVEQSNSRGGTCSPEEAEAGQCFGGWARLTAAVGDVRQRESNVLLLDGGDQFQGTPWFTYFRGIEAATFMNRLDYTAMAIGNHEYDRGAAGLSYFLDNVTFPVLSVNTDVSAEPLLDGKIMQSTIVQRSGIKIGIVGYTTPETAYLVDPSGIENVEFNEVIPAVRTEVARLREAEGAKVVIALGHAGYTVDRQIAAAVGGLQLVVGGHSNTFLYSGGAPSSEEPAGPYPTLVDGADGVPVPVVQAYAYGKYLGRLDVEFDDDGRLLSVDGRPILLNSSIAQDDATLVLVEQMKVSLENFTNTKVGRTAVTLDTANRACRLKECNIGNFMADAFVHFGLFREKQQPHDWTEYPLAVVNSGGLRATLSQGEITLADLLTSFPFGNELVKVDLLGRHLLAMLRQSVSLFDPVDPRGRFLQYSGFRVTYNRSVMLAGPDGVGDPVVSVEVRCGRCAVPEFEPLDLQRNYSVLMNVYMYNGGDGYSMIKEYGTNMLPFGEKDYDVAAKYLGEMSPITTPLEGRVKFVESRFGVSGSVAVYSSRQFFRLVALVFIFRRATSC